MKWLGQGTKDGRLDFGDHNSKSIRQYLSQNGPVRLELSVLTPESRKQRKFYFGAVLPLWAFLDGKDYKDSDTIEILHDIAKIEFNGQIMMIAGKPRKVGKSTKGELNEYLDRVIDFLEEQYGIDRGNVLDPEDYKHFKDEIYSTQLQYTDYIDYLLQSGKLIKN